MHRLIQWNEAVPKCQQNPCIITQLGEFAGGFFAVTGVISGDADFFLMILWKHSAPL